MHASILTQAHVEPQRQPQEPQPEPLHTPLAEEAVVASVIGEQAASRTLDVTCL